VARKRVAMTAAFGRKTSSRRRLPLLRNVAPARVMLSQNIKPREKSRPYPGAISWSLNTISLILIVTGPWSSGLAIRPYGFFAIRSSDPMIFGTSGYQ